MTSILLPELLIGKIGLEVSPVPEATGAGVTGAGLVAKTELEFGCIVIGFSTGFGGVVDIGVEVETEMLALLSELDVVAVGTDGAELDGIGFALGADVVTGLSSDGITSGDTAGDVKGVVTGGIGVGFATGVGAGAEPSAGFAFVFGIVSVGGVVGFEKDCVGAGFAFTIGAGAGVAGLGCQGFAAVDGENDGAGFGFGIADTVDEFADTGTAGGVDITAEAGIANGEDETGALGIDVEIGVGVGADNGVAGITGVGLGVTDGIGVGVGVVGVIGFGLGIAASVGFGVDDGAWVEVGVGVVVEKGVAGLGVENGDETGDGFGVDDGVAAGAGVGVGFELGFGQLLFALKESDFGKFVLGAAKEGGVGGVETVDAVGVGEAGTAKGLNGAGLFEVKVGLVSNGLSFGLLSKGLLLFELLPNVLFSSDFGSNGLLANGLSLNDADAGFGMPLGWKFTLTGTVEVVPKFCFGWLKSFFGKLSAIAGLSSLLLLSILSIGTRPTLAGSLAISASI